ncbi:YbjN domain-containing protein [Shimia sagamensis]|uniref:Diacylglyceryl transferase n=1 Tax=Shimia sagamensis TaxID=1566352 RepID=A0ABY1P611_9RHOB|nr:YbjN domain-containing protein [Shimia sagamensis]SMP26387.1 hypothetical protein SAMN06265373_105233 [Shimia sagamensis]
MALSEQFLEEDLHPIDIVEHIAGVRDWTFERIADDQIAMEVEGQWKTYSITLAWSAYDETLKLVCSHEAQPPKERLPALYETLNAVNDECWAGAFTYWGKQQLMIYRYGLVLAGGQVASPDQIDALIREAIQNSERFYPAFQLVVWGERTVKDAMQVAIAEAYGRA